MYRLIRARTTVSSHSDRIETMRFPGSRKANYELNRGCIISGRMINGQGLGDVSRLRYGLCRMGFNGCEVISVYNALQFIGKPQPLQEVAFFLEKYRLLLGFFGCNVFRLGKALDKFGAAYERIGEIGDTPAFIISFWTGRPMMSAVHTVFCTRENGRFKAYNRYNNCGTVRYGDAPEDIFGKYKPLAIYSIKI